MELISVKQASRRCGLSQSTLRRLVKEGLVEGAKYGRDWLLSSSDFERYLESKPRRSKTSSKGRRGPLHGTRIIDLTRALAGPYGSLLLADMGAEVIKVETLEGRRETSSLYSFKGHDVYFLSINRNKKSIVVDLKAPQGKEILYDLVKKSDVVYDNYRPGVTKRLKIGYDTLKKYNPKIICCSLSGFGATGPDKDRPAYDLVIQAMSGGMSITGEGGRPPVRAGVPIADEGGGMFAALGILAALYERERTGTGQWVDTSLLDGQISLLAYVAALYLATGIVPGRAGTGHTLVVPYRQFETKDGYMTIAASDRFEKFCQTIGCQELVTDPRFDTREKLSENRNELYDICEKIFRTKTTDEWYKILVDGDIPCSPIHTIDKALAEPQVQARNMLVTIDFVEGGQLKQVGNPIKMSATPQQVFESPPLYGQHTDEILSGLLSYPRQKIEALRQGKVIV